MDAILPGLRPFVPGGVFTPGGKFLLLLSSFFYLFCLVYVAYKAMRSADKRRKRWMAALFFVSTYLSLNSIAAQMTSGHNQEDWHATVILWLASIVLLASPVGVFVLNGMERILFGWTAGKAGSGFLLGDRRNAAVKETPPPRV